MTSSVRDRQRGYISVGYGQALVWRNHSPLCRELDGHKPSRVSGSRGSGVAGFELGFEGALEAFVAKFGGEVFSYGLTTADGTVTTKFIAEMTPLASRESVARAVERLNSLARPGGANDGLGNGQCGFHR